MNWKLKGLIQKALGHTPAGDRIHLALQRRGGGLRSFDRECQTKIEDWRLMVEHFRTLGLPLRDARLMEMGSGWYPTFPFCMFLAGAARVHTLDLTHHLQADMTIRLAERIGDAIDVIVEAGDRSRAEVTRLHDHLVSTLRRGGSPERATGGTVRYSAPADARRTNFADGSFDVVYSNTVLEHVPAEDIVLCMREARRILKSGGTMIHSINCGDHYAYVDPSIHQLNYLRYSEAAWRKWDNPFLYQNRLRAKDFVAMAEECGFEVVINIARPSEERRAQLRAMTIANCFAHYTPDELCVTSTELVGRNP
jgi:ubiquinone/menaquinone biosynthesis C-methylase UbiE